MVWIWSIGQGLVTMTTVQGWCWWLQQTCVHLTARCLQWGMRGRPLVIWIFVNKLVLFFTNTFFTLDKCIQQFRQIHFAIWTKTIYSEACTPCIGRTTARDLNICEQTVSHLSPDQIFDSPPNILQHIFCIQYSRSNIWVFVSKLVPICQHIKSLLLFAIVAKEDL